jgi:hypothetical protein
MTRMASAPYDISPLKFEGSCANLAGLLDVRLEHHLGPVLVRWLYLGSLAQMRLSASICPGRE